MQKQAKRLLLALTATGAIAAPLHVMAQSSVTLYGTIDEGVEYTSNVSGKSNVEQTAGA